MRIVFIGRDNVFNRRIIKELSTQHEIAGSFFVEPQRGTRLGKLKRIKSRVQKYGVFKLADELVFHCFDRLVLRSKEAEFYKTRPEYSSEIDMINAPECVADNIHDAEYVEIIKELKPDIIFSVCCSVFFKPELYEIPSLGTYVLHEGMAPQYKGLHNNLWALMKKDYRHIGYSVIKINKQIDAGEILISGKYVLGNNENYRTWGWVSHNAIIEGMADIKLALRQLEKNKQFVPVVNEEGESNYYTWIGFTDFVKLYIRNYLPEILLKRYESLAAFKQ
jgi:methionyl-tRNA formyltransferase